MVEHGGAPPPLPPPLPDGDDGACCECVGAGKLDSDGSWLWEIILLKLIELLVPPLSPYEAGVEDSEADEDEDEGEGGMLAGADPELAFNAAAAAAADSEVGDMGGRFPEANVTEGAGDGEDADEVEDDVEFSEEGCCCCCCCGLWSSPNLPEYTVEELVDESEEIVEANEKDDERGDDSGDSAGGVKTERWLLDCAAREGAENDDMAIGALCSACIDCAFIAPAPTVGEKFPLIGRELLLPMLLASLPRREFGVESNLE